MDIQVISLFGDVYNFLAIMLSQLLGVQRLKAVFIYNIVELHLKSMFLLSLFVQTYRPTDYIYQ